VDVFEHVTRTHLKHNKKISTGPAARQPAGKGVLEYLWRFGFPYTVYLVLLAMSFSSFSAADSADIRRLFTVLYIHLIIYLFIHSFIHNVYSYMTGTTGEWTGVPSRVLRCRYVGVTRIAKQTSGKHLAATTRTNCCICK